MNMRCCRCGKEIKGGYYNAPSGLYCPDCWERKPKQSRKEEENLALNKGLLIGLAKIMGKK